MKNMALKYSEQAQNKIVVYYIMPDEDKYIIDSIIKNGNGRIRRKHIKETERR